MFGVKSKRKTTEAGGQAGENTNEWEEDREGWRLESPLCAPSNAVIRSRERIREQSFDSAVSEVEVQ